MSKLPSPGGVLVTGGSGLVGRFVVSCLAKRGHSVVSQSPEPAGPAARELWQGLDVVEVVGDANDTDEVARLLEGRRIRLIVHAGAITSPPADFRDGLRKYVSTNVAATASVIEAAMRANASRVVYVSSASVYQAAPSPIGVITEDDGVRLDSLYAATKVASEAVVRAAGARGLDARIARVAATFGPHESPTPLRLDVSAVAQVVGALREGYAVNLTDPLGGLDWTYAADIGTAISLLVDTAELKHNTYNVSGGVFVTYSELLAAATAAVASRPNLRASDRETVEIGPSPDSRRQPLSVRRLVEDTGFTPGFPLTLAIAETVKGELN